MGREAWRPQTIRTVTLLQPWGGKQWGERIAQNKRRIGSFHQAVCTKILHSSGYPRALYSVDVEYVPNETLY